MQKWRVDPAFSIAGPEKSHMLPEVLNILAGLPPALSGESFETIV